jgi:hypothetical protein
MGGRAEARNLLSQINAVGRVPKTLAHGPTAFHHRKGRAGDDHCQLACNRQRLVCPLGNTMKAGVHRGRRLLFGDPGMSPMKRCLAAFAIAASPFAPVAHANDALEAKVRTYVPVVSLAKVCDIRISDAVAGDHRAMLEAVKSDQNANKLAYRLHYEAQTAYIKARDGGQRVAFCKDFIAANSQYAKARFTAVVEGHMSDVSTSVQKAIAHNVCGAPPAKLSRADWKPYALIKKMIQTEQNLAREKAETNGWNVTEETTAVTEQFCAAVKTR